MDTTIDARTLVLRSENLGPLVGSDGKSGVLMERIRADGVTYIVKHTSPQTDWIHRIMGGGTEPQAFQLWSSELLERVPGDIDHTIVGVVADDGDFAIVMRDVGAYLVPEGDDPVPEDQHLRFLDHMAALHAAFWGFEDSIGLTTPHGYYLAFSPGRVAAELAVDAVPGPITYSQQGWARLRETSPVFRRIVLPLHIDPSPMIDAMQRLPQTFVHGDWKMGNLGSHPDGRTILLDWSYGGRAPAVRDLAHYLSLNRARLPHSKEDAIAAYREALQRRGIDTTGWWDAMLGLCLLGVMVCLGWEKVFGDADELAWWEERIQEAVRWL